MRWGAAIALAACGRIGFGGEEGAIQTDAHSGDGSTPIGDVADVDTGQAQAQALRQEVTGTAATGGVLTLTFSAMPTNGSLLVMVGGDPQSSLTSVTGGGAMWRLAARSNENRNVEIWYGIANGSSATVTVTLVNSISPLMASVSEWQGIARPNPLDAANAASGTTSPAAASIVTTNARDLIVFGAANEQPNTWGAPTPGAWTAMTPISSDGTQKQWYRIVDVAGPIMPRVSETRGWWDAAVAAFRLE